MVCLRNIFINTLHKRDIDDDDDDNNNNNNSLIIIIIITIQHRYSSNYYVMQKHALLAVWLVSNPNIF
jgi:hypothetical protein